MVDADLWDGMSGKYVKNAWRLHNSEGLKFGALAHCENVLLAYSMNNVIHFSINLPATQRG